MSSRGSFLGSGVILLVVALVPSALIAGSVLVSNPVWQFLGPQPVVGVVPNYGGIGLPGAPFHATGRVTSIVVDPTADGNCGPSNNSACRIFVGTAG